MVRRNMITEKAATLRIRNTEPTYTKAKQKIKNNEKKKKPRTHPVYHHLASKHKEVDIADH